VFAVKAYADGALGSRGAALLEPYADDPGNRGLVRTTPDTLERLARRCLERGYSLCVHAIGDRANRSVLDAMEHAAAAAPAMPLFERRFRIEHAQVLSLEDIPRFASLGVIASMQPTHCTSDMPWAETRLGAARIEGAYAWRRLLKAGARLALGSDFPVEDPNPLLGIYAAVTTQDVKGKPPGGYRPGEKLTIWEALRGFTSDAAYAAFAEHELGLAEPGYRADLAVFDRDLTVIPAHEIPNVRCVMTMVGGDIVWNGKR
jgi:predicted amidohydrolase YtcJ